LDWRDNSIGLERPVDGAFIDAEWRSAARSAFPLENRKAFQGSGACCPREHTTNHPAWAVLVKNRRSVELSPRQGAQKLVPGMLADVLIITERTLLAYFLGPIKHRLAKAMREN
jgi:hypothetical protein